MVGSMASPAAPFTQDLVPTTTRLVSFRRGLRVATGGYSFQGGI